MEPDRRRIGIAAAGHRDAPPATDSSDQPDKNPPVENQRPQTGTGGDQPTNPPEGQK
ncbi:hypothetical protein Q644_03615 [Brucella intermedia 229E]|uniref:Uncharacterized protein n=1 Tax=Brucella intermedia 229E TaxID=1337887 RepID=U4VDW9_9HYPH|nr:hypothetical protein Q644_03615 [Brucella intermedia 229E]